MRYILTTRQEEHLGVLHRPTGDRDLLVYAADDPERVERSIALTPDEAHHIAELLHHTVAVDVEWHGQPNGEPDGVAVVGIRVSADSPYVGRQIGDIRADEGNVTILAVIQDRRVIAAPDPSLELRHGDTLITAGRPQDIAALADTIGHESSSTAPPG